MSRIAGRHFTLRATKEAPKTQLNSQMERPSGTRGEVCGRIPNMGAFALEELGCLLPACGCVQQPTSTPLPKPAVEEFLWLLHQVGLINH